MRIVRLLRRIGRTTYPLAVPEKRCVAAEMVALEGRRLFATSKVVEFGGPRRTRTCDPLIKSQLLYQLS